MLKSLNVLVLNIIEKAVSIYFDTLDEMISDKRIDELKAGKTEVYSLEKLLFQSLL